jgi:hypothetical protein
MCISSTFQDNPCDICAGFNDQGIVISRMGGANNLQDYEGLIKFFNLKIQATAQ